MQSDPLSIVLQKINDPTILVLLLVCAAMAFMIWQHIKYDREDREKLLTSLSAIKDAIVDVKSAFSDKAAEIKVAIASMRDK